MTVSTMYQQTVTTAQQGTATGIQNSPASPTYVKAQRKRSLSSGNADIDAIFDTAGRKYNISPNLLKAIAKVESNFKADMVSKAGAMGIMQIMPGTAKYLGIDDPFDIEQNITGGARYIKEQLDRFSGNAQLAIAAYNAGWPSVIKHGGIPPFKETRAYVCKVLSYMGSDKLTTNDLTYSGYSVMQTPSHPQSATQAPAATQEKTTFDFHEALAQMLFIKMIEKQMSTHGNKM